MVNTKFEAYKLRRELTRSGRNFTFIREGVNKYGEPNGEPHELGTIMGIYHEQNSNILLTTGETTQIRSKKTPMVLCLYDDVDLLKLETGDYVMINGRKFNVTGVVDVQEWQIISDISLELVDDVTQD